MSHTLEWYKQYDDEHGYELTDKAEKVIEMVDKCCSYCPCRFTMWKKANKTDEEMEQIRCPCVFIEEDMKHTKNHTCHCNLLKKKEEE